MQAEPGYLPWQVELLQRALDYQHNNRLAHAVLLEVASSQDISPLLTHLSMLLLCDAPEGIDVCGQCEACRMMRAGTYSDFRLLTLEADEKTKKMSKNIKIEQIRNLIHEVNLTHQYQRLKIAVIYPAERMNAASANALLKTLEEPAAGILLLVVTHNKGRIPVTIRSRCQHWNLPLPDRETARSWLQEQGLDPEEAALYLQFAQGDPVLAQMLQQQDYASMVDGFKRRLAEFLRGDNSVAELGKSLLGFELDSIRRLIDMTLRAYCLQMSGVDAQAQPVDGSDPERARALFELQWRATRQLQIEENNLDLQLQLEDVLISLKQILSRRPI